MPEATEIEPTHEETPAERPVLPPDLWALRVVLREAGLELSEPLLFGLAGGAGFVADAGAAPGRSAFLTGWDPAQSSLPTAASHLGVVAALQETARAGRAAEQLEALLAERTPVIVWVDRAVLLSDDAPPGVTLPTGVGAAVVTPTSAARYSVALAGHLCVFATAEQLAEARHGAGMANRLLAVRGGEIDLPRAVRGGLAMTALGGARHKKRAHGPSGVAELAGRIVDTGRRGWQRRFGADGELAGALEAFAAAVESQDGLWRDAQAAYLTLAGDLLQLPAISQLAEPYARLAADWRAVAAQARAAAQAGEPAADLAALGAAVSAIAAREAATLEQLRATLRAN